MPNAAGMGERAGEVDAVEKPLPRVMGLMPLPIGVGLT